MRHLLVLAALILAGCATATDTDAPPVAQHAPLTFTGGTVVHADCTGSCYEPSVAVDGAGRIVVSASRTGTFVLSEDEGNTWEALPHPPVPGALDALQGDILFQRTPDGRLYFSALLLRTLPDGSFMLEGIQVAATADGGRTWELNQAVTPLQTPTDAVYAADRQWLGFADDGTLYLSYNQIPTGIWTARSDDGGATWTQWTRAHPLETRNGIGQSGPPVVDAQGRVLVPGCVVGGGVAVAVSEDRGASWREEARVGTGCTWFPILFAAGNETGLAVITPQGGIHVHQRAADGTWSDPVLWAEDGATSPWPAMDAAGRVLVAWWDQQGDLHVSRGTWQGPEEDVVVAADLSTPNTDFAHLDLYQGVVHVTWSDRTDGSLWTARATSV